MPLLLSQGPLGSAVSVMSLLRSNLSTPVGQKPIANGRDCSEVEEVLVLAMVLKHYFFSGRGA